MDGDFDPHIGQRTHHLKQQRRHDHCGQESGDVERAHEDVETAVAHDVDDVGHEAAFAAAHLVARPAIDAPIEVDSDEWKNPRKDDHNACKGQAVVVVELVEVAEHQEQRHRHRGKIERIEEGGNGARCEDEIFIVHCFVTIAG